MGREDELDDIAVQDATTGFLERLLVKSTRIVSVSCDFLLNPTSMEDTSAYSEAFGISGENDEIRCCDDLGTQGACVRQIEQYRSRSGFPSAMALSIWLSTPKQPLFPTHSMAGS